MNCVENFHFIFKSQFYIERRMIYNKCFYIMQISMYLHCKLFKHIFVENTGEDVIFYKIPEAEKFSVSL